MKKLMGLILVIFIFMLSGCDMFAEEETVKTMQDFNIDDVVEAKMEIIWTYTGPFIEDEYKEIYYNDFEEEYYYLEYTNYLPNGVSYYYYLETINGTTYMYDYDDIDFDILETPSRFRIDYMDGESDFTFTDAFANEFVGIEAGDDQGYDHWYKDIKIGDLTEMLQGYIYSLVGPDYSDETIGVEMWCHPTSDYCDYLLHVDSIANGTVIETIEDLELDIAITYTFYTEDNKSKEDVLPETYLEDDYPNTIDSLMLTGNRIFGQHYTGTINFEYDGDCFLFEVDNTGRYVIEFENEVIEEDELYFLILDDTYMPIFEGVFDSSSFIQSMDLAVDVTYVLIVGASDGTRIDIDYDFYINELD